MDDTAVRGSSLSLGGQNVQGRQTRHNMQHFVIRNARQILGLVVIASGVLSTTWGVQHMNDPLTAVNWRGFPILMRPRFAEGVSYGIALIVLGTMIIRARRE